jgi:hypothetical protein
MLKILQHLIEILLLLNYLLYLTLVGSVAQTIGLKLVEDDEVEYK